MARTIVIQKPAAIVNCTIPDPTPGERAGQRGTAQPQRPSAHVEPGPRYRSIAETEPDAGGQVLASVSLGHDFTQTAAVGGGEPSSKAIMITVVMIVATRPTASSPSKDTLQYDFTVSIQMCREGLISYR